MKEIKENIAKNLTLLRIQNKYTQSDIAKKLNYTDKSVSKWEKGDATPPIDILKEIATLYGVTLDFLTEEHTDVSNVTFDKRYNSPSNYSNKIIITCLAVSLVWVVACVLFVYGMELANTIFWQFFIYSLPITFIVLLIFNGIWGKRKYIFIISSMLIWSILLSIFILFLDHTPWGTFIVGIPLQIAIILWSKMKTSK